MKKFIIDVVDNDSYAFQSVKTPTIIKCGECILMNNSVWTFPCEVYFYKQLTKELGDYCVPSGLQAWLNIDNQMNSCVIYSAEVSKFNFEEKYNVLITTKTVSNYSNDLIRKGCSFFLNAGSYAFAEGTIVAAVYEESNEEFRARVASSLQRTKMGMWPF